MEYQETLKCHSFDKAIRLDGEIAKTNWYQFLKRRKLKIERRKIMDLILTL